MVVKLISGERVDDSGFDGAGDNTAAAKKISSEAMLLAAVTQAARTALDVEAGLTSSDLLNAYRAGVTPDGINADARTSDLTAAVRTAIKSGQPREKVMGAMQKGMEGLVTRHAEKEGAENRGIGWSGGKKSQVSGHGWGGR